MTRQDIISMLMQGQNPQQIVMSFLKENSQSNPMAANLLSLAQQGNMEQIEKIGRNLAASFGIDFDKAFEQFKGILGTKNFSNFK